MIKPYYKHEHKAKIVEVEDFGVINLNELPIKIHKDKVGLYEIGWAIRDINGEKYYELSETGGVSLFDFGGRALGIIKEIE